MRNCDIVSTILFSKLKEYFCIRSAEILVTSIFFLRYRPFDRKTGRAGAPLLAVKMKLVNWDEGNYRITDKPNPRGEIHIGGHNVALGYYKNPDKTEEDFYDSEGLRWFRTGDIGEFDEDGVIR